MLICSGYLPNCKEAVQAMLAAASVGAVWSSTSPDFGVTVSDLFSNICSVYTLAGQWPNQPNGLVSEEDNISHMDNFCFLCFNLICIGVR